MSRFVAQMKDTQMPMLRIRRIALVVSPCIVLLFTACQKSSNQRRVESTGVASSPTSTVYPSEENADAESTGTSERESSRSDGTQGEVLCRDLVDTICLDPAPKGWNGPIQPQSASQAGDLAPCEGADDGSLFVEWDVSLDHPNPLRNVYVDEVEAPEITCEGCKFEADAGDCRPTAWVIRAYDSESRECGGSLDRFGFMPIAPGCNLLNSGGNELGSKMAMGLAVATPKLKEPRCLPTVPKTSEIPAVRFPRFHRICGGGRRLAACQNEGQECMHFSDIAAAPRHPKACIFKTGIHECSNPAYPSQRVLYSWFSDTRSCGTCEPVVKGDSLTCGTLALKSDNDPKLECSVMSRIEPSELCLPASYFDEVRKRGTAPTFSVQSDEKATFTGSCEAPNWKPQGKVTLEAPVTLCCKDLKLPVR